MTVITFPSNCKDIIDQIRGVIGRDVTFYLQHRTNCSACSIDPTTDNSINPFCIVCSGNGYIYTYSGVSLSGHITWNNFDQMNWVAGGQYFEGDCRLQIEYTPSNITVVDIAKYVVVDGKKLTVKSKIYRGVKDLNRIVINLVEEEG